MKPYIYVWPRYIGVSNELPDDLLHELLLFPIYISLYRDDVSE